MVELQCRKCSFQFESSREVLVCPNCGGKNCVTRVPSAADILQDIDNIQKEKEESGRY